MLEKFPYIHWRLGPAQDVQFFYTPSHMSAIQNCALIVSTNFQFIFTIKNALHNLVIESFSAPKYFKNISRLFIFGLEIWEPVNPLMNFFPMLEIHMTTLRTALDCMFSLGTVEEPPISSNFHLTSGMVLWWIFGKFPFDLVQTKTSTFSTHSLIWVHFKTVLYFS